MSVLRNPVKRQSFAAPADLNRLLLLYWFDFRQNGRELPALKIRRVRDSILSADPAALTSAASKTIFYFSDSSLRGAKPLKTADRRMGVRRSRKRPFGGNQKTTERCD
jgi:hypothetical protein